MTRKFDCKETGVLTFSDDGHATWQDGVESLATIEACESWVKAGTAVEVFDVPDNAALIAVAADAKKKRVVANRNANRDTWTTRAFKAELRVHELEAANEKQAVELARLYTENNMLLDKESTIVDRMIIRLAKWVKGGAK